jgi:secreted Zn-dependent insulinase-like peptidase
LKTEKYYNTQYLTERISDEQIDLWKNAKSQDGERLGNCPPNIFIPTWPLIPCKKSKADGERDSVPQLLQHSGQSKVYFLQDDKFDQPIVYA